MGCGSGGWDTVCKAGRDIGQICLVTNMVKVKCGKLNGFYSCEARPSLAAVASAAAASAKAASQAKFFSDNLNPILTKNRNLPDANIGKVCLYGLLFCEYYCVRYNYVL